MKKLHIAAILIIAALLLAVNADAEQIRIASWNIQTFGEAKAAKPDVMRVIAETITQFDLVAIEEVRDKSGAAIEELERQVDALGVDYSVVVSERLGRTHNKEQYAFIFKADKISGAYVKQLTDPGDIFHREPLIGRFSTVTEGHVMAFTLAVIHTDPDEARQEIPALFDVVLPKLEGSSVLTGNILIAGDFNADCRYYDELQFPGLVRNSGMVSLIGNNLDTTVKRTVCTYDRMVATPGMAAQVVGSGVYWDGITEEVSDHYPVFVVLETGEK